MSELLQKVEEYVRKEYSREGWNDFDYHNLDHTVNVVKEVMELAELSGLSQAHTEQLIIAAWFHDLGYEIEVDGHEEISAEIAAKFLKENDATDHVIEEIRNLILATKVNYEDFNVLPKKIIRDADLSNAGLKGFVKWSRTLRSEWSKKLERNFEDKEWDDLQLNYLSNLEYLSPAGIERYDARRIKNLKTYKKKTKKKTPTVVKKLGRGIETMYRSTYRNQINLSAIADNKANMMIGINAVIISLVLTIFGSGIVGPFDSLLSNLTLMLPLGALILSSSVAMVFSVLSARPNIVVNKIDYDPESPKAINGILFFGNYTSLSQADFNQYMTSLQDNENLTYENMNSDIYNLGTVLLKKYSLLRRAYNIFMLGLIVSIVLFFLLFSFGGLS